MRQLLQIVLLNNTNTLQCNGLFTSAPWEVPYLKQSTQPSQLIKKISCAASRQPASSEKRSPPTPPFHHNGQEMYPLLRIQKRRLNSLCYMKLLDSTAIQPRKCRFYPYLQCHGSNRHCKYGSNQEAGTVVEVITVHIDPNKGDESNNKIADLFEKSNLNTEYWNRLSQASPRMAYAFPK